MMAENDAQKTRSNGDPLTVPRVEVKRSVAQACLVLCQTCLATLPDKQDANRGLRWVEQQLEQALGEQVEGG